MSIVVEVFSTTAMPKSRASRMAMNWTFRIGIAAIAGLGLSGCASETASRIFVEPDRYVLYSCKELANQAQGNFARQHELELLMAKAGPGGGQIASAMAYQPEYAQLRGEMTQLRKAAADRKCPPLSSGAPAPAAGGRTSDQVVR
jgi:hypothetical protein